MKKAVFIAIELFLCLTASTAMADVTLETVIKSDGLKGLGAHEGITVSRIQGLKMAESNSTKFTGAILSRLSGGTDKTTITRVDKGVIWELDARAKSYTELVITPFQMPESGKKGEEKPRMRVTKSEFTVEKTGASETINGFPCEEYILHWLVEMEDLETKTTMKNSMESRLWTTPETAAIRKMNEEQNAFGSAYMKKVGINMSSGEMKQLGMEALAAGGASQKEINKEFARLKKEMAKLKGYPIRTVVAWQTKGESAPQAAKRDSPEGDNPAMALGKLFGGLKGTLGRKMGGGESKPPASEGPLFSSTAEVRSIQIDSIPASVFELPPGYVRQ
jgi:hypothetical protein